MDSLPTPGIPRGQLPVIAGRPPLTGEQISGCAFNPRCPVAVPDCSVSRPSLVHTDDGRAAACPVVMREPEPTPLPDQTGVTV
jgi:oligopeptide/dipeptide ABC transporter ATP-binding protein